MDEGNKIPLNLAIETFGKQGAYEVKLGIVSSNRRGVPGIIRFIANEGSIDLKTDENGVLKVKIKVTEENKKYRIQVLGTSIGRIIELDGPMFSGVLSKDFMGRLKEAYQKGRYGDDLTEKKRRFYKVISIEEQIQPIIDFNFYPAKKIDPPKKDRIEELLERSMREIEAEKELEKRLREAGWPDEDIEAKIRDFRQKLYHRE